MTLLNLMTIHCFMQWTALEKGRGESRIEENYPTYPKDSQVKTYIDYLHIFADEVFCIITMNIIPVIL